MLIDFWQPSPTTELQHNASWWSYNSSFFHLSTCDAFSLRMQHAPLTASFDFQLRLLTGNTTAAVLHVQIKHLPRLSSYKSHKGLFGHDANFFADRTKNSAAHCFTLNRCLSLTPDEWNILQSWDSLFKVLMRPYVTLSLFLSPDSTLAVAEPLPKWNNW